MPRQGIVRALAQRRNGQAERGQNAGKVRLHQPLRLQSIQRLVRSGDHHSDAGHRSGMRWLSRK